MDRGGNVEPGERRRGRKVAVTLLVILFLIVGLVVVADRIAVNAAESRIAAETKKELDSRNIAIADDPRVSIAGFPFLTQVLNGEYRKISIDIDRPKTDEIQLNDLKLDVRVVQADTRAVMNGTGKVTAGRITGRATMSWEAVRAAIELSGLPNVIDPSEVKISILNNKIRMELPVVAAGIRTTARATGTLKLVEGAIRIQVETVELADGTVLPSVQRVVDQLRNQLTGTVRVPAMPYQLVIDKLETRAADVLIVASAHDVELTG